MGKLSLNQIIREGPAVELGSFRIRPFSRAVFFQGRSIGWVWNRPAYLQIDQSGSVRNIPILDYTRLLQVLFWTVSLFFVFGSVILSVGRRNRQ